MFSDVSPCSVHGYLKKSNAAEHVALFWSKTGQFNIVDSLLTDKTYCCCASDACCCASRAADKDGGAHVSTSDDCGDDFILFPAAPAFADLSLNSFP